MTPLDPIDPLGPSFVKNTVDDLVSEGACRERGEPGSLSEALEELRAIWTEVPTYDELMALRGRERGEQPEPLGWKTISDERPAPHARYEVWREEAGHFVATPCYGMHAPWWVPLTCDLYSPGSTAFQMEDLDMWRLWEPTVEPIGREQG